MKPRILLQALHRGLIALLTLLWMTLLCLTPLLSASFPQIAQRILNIEKESATAQGIFAYVREKAIDPSHEPTLAGLSYREITHLDDVSALIRNAYLVGGVAAGIVLLAAAIIPPTRRHWLQGLKLGAFLTFFLLIAGSALAILAWDSAFWSFHQLFFAPGSWQFSTSSTLIRNFPPRFWFFAVLIYAGCMALTAGAILLFTNRAIRTSVESNPPRR